jgi:copper(I)-binding protein
MKHAYLFLAAILALIASRAGAMDYDVGPIHIAQPWTRATPKGAAVAGGYMKITNKGTESDRMSCVSATVATQCQIHNMTIEQGVAKMRPLPDGLEIKPGASVELKPGSLHLMFVGLKQPLEKGKQVKGMLRFEKAGSVEVEFTVEAIGASTAVPMGGMHHH